MKYDPRKIKKRVSLLRPVSMGLRNGKQKDTKYNFQKTEKKWQKEWERQRLYAAKDGSVKPKWYSLVEFPYPSGDGLHVGHVRSYTAMDIISRKRRMEGMNVIYPMGWDAFGLPTENYAIKTGIPPAKVTKQNSDNFRRQLKALGFSFDWDREVNTSDPEYYKWTQWIFLKLFEKGLAYKKETLINWCPKDKIGLANEEVIQKKQKTENLKLETVSVCERCGTPVEQRKKEQWMLKITEYADKLLEGLGDLDFLPEIKLQQKNWIGKSEGVLVNFQLKTENLKLKSHKVQVFTTRPDTIFGVTFIAISKDLARKWIDIGWQANEEVKNYLEEQGNRNNGRREDEEKTGVFSGVYAVNPATGGEVPVWVVNYVLEYVGTGAVMGVPAHDSRDYDFAKKYQLPIKLVVWKKNAPIKSYLMGGREITDEDLINLNVQIVEKNSSGDRKLIIPYDRTHDYERLIIKKLEPGYWNEYIGPDTVFIFKHDDGTVERIELDARTEARIDKIAHTFVKKKWNVRGVWRWLSDNSWYRDVLIHEDSGTLVHSGQFSGKDSEDAQKQISRFVSAISSVHFKLRDWVFSRQRYWGEPIPLVFCESCRKQVELKTSASARASADRQNSKLKTEGCSRGEILNPGWIPVLEKDLPVELPKVKNYQPRDDGQSPLASAEKWVNTICPRCKGPARRETDTMPNWAGSSWYYLAYALGARNLKLKTKNSWNQNLLKYWMPVDWYNGGMEHVTLHLLYSRFWNLFLYDIGLIPFAEPYKKRTAHGLILAGGGVKMSKSKGNVVNPDTLIAEFGSDALRLYEMFLGPFNQAVAWDPKGIVGTSRFLEKVWNIGTTKVTSETQNSKLKTKNLKLGTSQSFAAEQIENLKLETGNTNTELERKTNRLIKKVSEDIEKMAFNTAVSEMMIFINSLSTAETVPVRLWMQFLRLLAPLAPHVAEELWCVAQNVERGIRKAKKINSIHKESWPVFNPLLLTQDVFELVIQVNGKVKDRVSVPLTITKEEAEVLALSLPKVQELLGSAKPFRVIYVIGRLVNIVI